MQLIYDIQNGDFAGQCIHEPQ